MLDQLRADDRLKNTYVIFTSDHGLAIGSHGLMGKQNMYNHTIRVPFLITGPGVAKGQRTEAFGYLRDMYPTVCELAGIEIPEIVQAKSLVPVLRGHRRIVHKAAYGYFRDVQRMIQMKEWKLVFYPKIDRYQLFNLGQDPHELKDLIGNDRHQPRVALMRQSLGQWFKDRGDTLFQPRE